MQKVIKRKLYDTDTAEEIGFYRNSCDESDFSFYKECLYRKKTGEFFLYGYGNDLSKYGLAEVNGIEGSVEVIIPFTDEEAKDWIERYSDAHTYIELFGVPEE